MSSIGLAPPCQSWLLFTTCVSPVSLLLRKVTLTSVISHLCDKACECCDSGTGNICGFAFLESSCCNGISQARWSHFSSCETRPVVWTLILFLSSCSLSHESSKSLNEDRDAVQASLDGKAAGRRRWGALATSFMLHWCCLGVQLSSFCSSS